MHLGELVEQLDDRLDVSAYADTDPSQNGLQVGDPSATVDTVVGAVDAAMEPIDRAAGEGADLLLVHHGLLWRDGGPLTGLRYERIRALVEADMALYAAHLPLDGHQTLGNAAVIADALALLSREPFPDAEAPVGLIGSVHGETDFPTFGGDLAEAVDVGFDRIMTLGPEPRTIERVAIVTGSGTGYLEDAAAAGADVLITGEPKHGAYHEAADLDLPVMLAGHYATETGGVRLVLDVLDEWGLSTAFVDVPTGI